MTTQIIDFSEIDLTGGLRFNGEAIGAAHYNGERLWPFGVDLLYTGGIGGASYLPDTGAVFADTAAATPATFGGSIARTNPAGGAGNALQASASLRPLLGRAPKAGRRNQLTWTEELDNPAWVKSAATVVPNAAIAPNGELTADALIPDTSNAVHRAAISFPYVATTGVGSLYVKSAGARYFGIGTVSTSPERYAFFDFENINVFTLASNSITEFPSVTVSDEGNGWYKITFAGPYLGGASTNALRLYVLGSMPVSVGGFPEASLAFVGDGVSGVYFWGHQIDTDTITPYQRIGAATDITEEGVPSYPFVRFDLSDDRLDTVLPQAVTGDVVIAGRNGAVIAPHSYAANSTFQLGPTSYTGGTPGILRAIGDVVGWSILNKTLTAAERERLMRFYKRRGAKGLLVPGPELVTNGTFDTGIAPWFLVGSGAVAWNPAGTMQISDVGGNDGRARLHVDVTPGAPYLVAYDVRTTQQFLLEWGDRGSGSNNGQVTDTFSTGGVFQRFSRVVLFTAAASSITLVQAGTDVTGEVDNVSIRELRPEEDW